MSHPVRAVEARDAERWSALYTRYRAFYRLPEDTGLTRTTWRWVRGGEHGLVGLVAVDEHDAPVALANLRWFARPIYGGIGLYLDDLFTATEVRGSGAATSLLHRAAEIAADGGANVIRWITEADNTAARRLYDKVAMATPWMTYDMKPR